MVGAMRLFIAIVVLAITSLVSIFFLVVCLAAGIRVVVEKLIIPNAHMLFTQSIVVNYLLYGGLVAFLLLSIILANYEYSKQLYRKADEEFYNNISD